MNWKEHKGFAVQKQTCDHEGKTLAVFCGINQIPIKFIYKTNEIPVDYIPSGTVNWITEALGVESIKPNYFPDFLKDWVKRNIWEEEKWPLKKVFIKPADKHKRFTGFITSGTYSKKKRGPFICSDIVHFKNEWRYYISNGKVLGAYWYYGDSDIEIPAPKLNIEYPNDWCGTADFGELNNGDIALIECHPPFACGWYGGYSKAEEYAEFLTLGWQWLKEKYKR